MSEKQHIQIPKLETQSDKIAGSMNCETLYNATMVIQYYIEISTLYKPHQLIKTLMSF